MFINSFSIIIPSFNDLRIIETIRSIKEQNYPSNKIEIIIMDGGSSQEVIEAIKNEICSNDILITEPDKGIFDGINKGLKLANNEILFALGSDDRFHSNEALQKINTKFDQTIDFLCVSIKYTDSHWKPVRNWQATYPSIFNIIFGRQIAHFGYFARKSMYRNIGYFNLKRTVAADFDYFLRVAKSRYKGSLIVEHLIDMKIGGNSSKNLKNVIKGNFDIFKAGFLHIGPLIFVHFLFKPFWKIKEFLTKNYNY